MMSRNVICGVKFGRFWTFDRRRPSWILRKMKNSSAGLFLGSSSMSMPNFVWIRWTGSKLLQKHWKSITRRKFLTAGGHLGFWEKWKILSQACSKGQVVCPCQILSGSDEPDPSYCKKCEFSSSWSPSTAATSTAATSTTTTALCDKAVHRASHFPVGAKNMYDILDLATVILTYNVTVKVQPNYRSLARKRPGRLKTRFS